MIVQNIAHLASSLGKQLIEKGWSVSCAESCTGGGIAFALTSVSGSSAWFERAFVTYSNQAKSDLLGVSLKTLQNFGAVSQQTVLEMASGCAAAANADLAISVSGIAGPDGGSVEKPVGTVWFGFSVEGDISCEMRVFNGDRDQIRQQAIAFALTHAHEILAR